MIDLGVLIMLLDLRELTRNVAHGRIDFTRARAMVDRRDDARHGTVGHAEYVEALHERDHTGIGEPVFLEVKVPGVFAAKRNVFIAHHFFDNRMPDFRTNGYAAVRDDRFGNAPAADQIVENLAAWIMAQRVDADERGDDISAN